MPVAQSSPVQQWGGYRRKISYSFEAGRVAPKVLPRKEVGAQRRANELKRQIGASRRVQEPADRSIHDASRNHPQLTRGKEKDCDLWQGGQEHEDIHMPPIR